MRRWLIVLACLILDGAALAEEESDFVTEYRAALESRDPRVLGTFLYARGADPNVVEFQIRLHELGLGDRIKSVELLVPEPKVLADYNTPSDQLGQGPHGLSVPATHQLVVTIEAVDFTGNGSRTRRYPVAEVEGDWFILVPMPLSQQG